MEKAARRRQVPAFGEWNYYYHYDEPEPTAAAPPALSSYCYATPEPEACSDVWFRYSPPARKPATPVKKKTVRRMPEGDDSSVEKKGRRSARQASEAGAGGGGGVARATRVVRPVDEDLYQVPPPEVASHRRRPRRRSLWMGCLGCVA
uniref:Uncharacterized protein n=1 Tax=Avena sativa TaxID=4498 RepID=A0ACD5Y033_AVESA